MEENYIKVIFIKDTKLHKKDEICNATISFNGKKIIYIIKDDTYDDDLFYVLGEIYDDTCVIPLYLYREKQIDSILEE